jgi:hypothetical protein
MEENRKNTLAALKREMDEMRAAYEAEIDVLKAENAKKQESAAEKAKFQAFLREQEDWLDEYVEIKLFKDNDKYKDDVYVAINGKNCQIRRGVWTRIRRKFALLLDQSEIQDLRTAELMEREEGRFMEESLKGGRA